MIIPLIDSLEYFEKLIDYVKNIDSKGDGAVANKRINALKCLFKEKGHAEELLLDEIIKLHNKS